MDNQAVGQVELSRGNEGKDGGHQDVLKSSGWGWGRSKFERITARYLQLWKNLFVLSCTIAVSLDPFFFYISKVDRDKLCVGKDKKMRTAAFVLRGITDTVLIVHLISLIYNRYNDNKHRVDPTEEANSLLDRKETKANFFRKRTEKIAQKMPWWMCVHLVVGLLCLVPVPQFLIGIIYRSLKYPQLSSDTGRSTKHSRDRNALYFAILAQYFPRIYQIQLSSKRVTKSHGILAKGLFNVFLFILASHVLGAFWYAFSLETEVSCWSLFCAALSVYPKACSAQSLCTTARIVDDEIRNVTAFKQYCYAGKDEYFLYGIFFDAIDSGSTSKDVRFSVKFWYSFWWGLRNISNYGTNLATTVYLWENVFAILVSIVGLLLFVFLIGNLQTFMEMKVQDTKSEETKLKAKRLDAQRWIARYGLPKDMETEILTNYLSKARLEEERDYTLENLFSFVPTETRHALRLCLCMETLKTVPMLATTDDAKLREMCDYLTPMTFKENKSIFRMGTPLDFMLFVIVGTVTYSTTSTTSESDQESGKEKTVIISPSSSIHVCKFYGDELLEWASSSTSPTDQPPMSTYNVTSSQGKVEALVLKDDDLKSIMRNNFTNRQGQLASSTITRRFHSNPSERPAVISTNEY